MEKKVIGSEIVKPNNNSKANNAPTIPQGGNNRKVKPTLNTDSYKDKMREERTTVLALTKQFGTGNVGGYGGRGG